MASKIRPFVLPVVVVSLSGVLEAQSWFQRQPVSNPGTRLGHVLTFDAARNRTVLFGGQSSFSYTSVTNQTWTWNGTNWTNMAPSASPPARAYHAMAYDPVRQKVVLFGGYQGTLSGYWGDTWEWDGVSWIPRVLFTSPSARAEHVMAFDSTRGKVVLHGGVGQVGTPAFETWEFDGVSWTQRFPVNSPAWGSAGGRSMITGPSGRCRYYHGGLVSEFDGAGVGNWSPVGAPIPGLGYGSYDLAPGTGGEMLVVSFRSSNAVVYEIGGSQWDVRVTTTAPGDREAQWVLDTARGVHVVYSGALGDSQTWEFDDNARLATATPFGSGCGSPVFQLAAAPGSRPLMGSTFQVRAQPAPSPLVFMALGQSDSVIGGSLALPLPLGGFGFIGCNLYQDSLVIDVPCPVAAGVASLNWPIPNLPQVLGFEVFLQAWSWAPGANPGGVVLTNGLHVTMGNV